MARRLFPRGSPQPASKLGRSFERHERLYRDSAVLVDRRLDELELLDRDGIDVPLSCPWLPGREQVQPGSRDVAILVAIADAGRRSAPGSSLAVMFSMSSSSGVLTWARLLRKISIDRANQGRWATVMIPGTAKPIRNDSRSRGSRDGGEVDIAGQRIRISFLFPRADGAERLVSGSPDLSSVFHL